MADKVAVIGGGSWGRALAGAAAKASEVLLHSRRSDLDLPRQVEQTQDVKRIGREARLIFLAVPTEHTAGVCASLGDHLDGSHYVVHGVRGLVGSAFETISDIVRRETPARRVGALGGPALADELLAGKPTLLVLASRFPEVQNAALRALGQDSVRIYMTSDLRGLEWSSAIVGCIAIIAGYAQGLGLGPGIVAGLVSRAVSEGARLVTAAGGDARTMMGLGGYGDLLAAVGQPGRPEVLLGRSLSRGVSLKDAENEASQHIEAVALVPRLVQFAKTHDVSVPLMDTLHSQVFQGHAPGDVVRSVMMLPIDDAA